MPGLALAVVVAAQWVIQLPKNPCFVLEAQIGGAAYDIFRDPTDTQRTEVTRRLTVDLLSSAHAADKLRRCELQDREAIDQIWEFADDSALPSSFRQGWTFGHPNRLSRSYLHLLTEEAIRDCTTARLVDCSARELSLLVVLGSDALPTLSAPEGVADFSRAHPDVLQDPRTLSEWTLLRRQFPDRSDFLTAAWRSHDATIRSWALGEATARIDPREWSPDDLAVFILEARRADAEASEIDKAPPLAKLQGFVADGELPEPRQREIEIRGELGRMGFERALDLIHPSDRGSVSLDLSARPGFNQHFSDEGQLYMADWLAQSGKKDAAKLSRAEMRDLGKECDRRWHETDALAPHPDLQLVWKAVDALEAKREAAIVPLERK